MRTSVGVVSSALQQAPASPPAGAAAGAAASPAAGAAGAAAGAPSSAACEQPTHAPAETSTAAVSPMMILRTASFPYPSCLELRFSVERIEGNSPRKFAGIVLSRARLVMEKNVAQRPRFGRPRTFRMSHRSRDFSTENTPSFERLAAIALIRGTIGASSVNSLGRKVMLINVAAKLRARLSGRTRTCSGCDAFQALDQLVTSKVSLSKV